jgi:hypothetical protein
VLKSGQQKCQKLCTRECPFAGLPLREGIIIQTFLLLHFLTILIERENLVRVSLTCWKAKHAALGNKHFSSYVIIYYTQTVAYFFVVYLTTLSVIQTLQEMTG